LGIFGRFWSQVRVGNLVQWGQTIQTFVIVFLVFLKIVAVLVTVIAFLFLTLIIFLLSGVSDNIWDLVTIFRFWYCVVRSNWEPLIVVFELVSRARVKIMPTLISYKVRLLVSKNDLFFLFLVLNQLSCLIRRQFRKINGLLSVIKGHNGPLFSLVIVFWLLDDLLNLVWR